MRTDEPIGNGTTTLDWLCHEYPWLMTIVKNGEKAESELKEIKEKLMAWADNGADEEKWPPGTDIVDAVLRYIEKLEKKSI